MGLKKVFQKWVLSSAIKSNGRKKVFNNLSKMKHVGIVFERNNDTTAQLVAKLAKFLHDQNIKIEVIAYVNLKKPTDELAQKKSLTLFYKKDLNWIGKPKSDEIQNFIRNKFDLLIKADFSHSFPIEYICAASQAALIAGPNDDLRNIYDFIIEVQNDSMNDFHQQLIHYLSIINQTP